MKRLLLLLAMFVPGALFAEIQERAVHYQQGDTELEGYVAYDASEPKERPAVLVIHDWMGITDRTKQVCKELVKLGYIAMAADVYGKDVRPKDTSEASQLAGKYKSDRALLRQRVQAAYDYVSKAPFVSKGKVAVIGYCFGGTAALELGRNGASQAGIVTFHGGLDSPTPEDGKKIKSPVLILHGADDPFIKPNDLEAFKKELNDAKVDWQMIYYSGAVHSFTNKSAGNDPSKGNAYQEAADRRSWQAMRTFFGEIFR